MWREGEATDLEFFKPLEDAVFGQPSPGNYLLGLMHMARGELELALECLKKAIQLSPDESDYQNVLGLVYFGLGNYAKSTQCFKKVVEGEPSNWRYQVNLTTSLLSEGIKEEAKKHLSRALSNQQGFLGVSSWLGISPTKDIETIIPLLHKVNVPLPRLLKTFKGHARGIVSVCFSPDGKSILSGSIDHTIKLWDMETSQCLKTFKGHEGTVNSVCFSPDGRLALSGSNDKTLKLWNLETGECLKTFEGHIDAVQSVSFSPDGRFAVSSQPPNTIKLWLFDWEWIFQD
jgi:WD40 repeat protein